MSRFVDIGALADAVLASVNTETNTKTASVQGDRLHTQVGRLLQKLGNDLREMPEDDEPSDEDLAALLQDQEMQEFLMLLDENPELLEQLLAESEQGAPPEEAGPPMDAPPMEAPPMEEESPMDGPPMDGPPMEAAPSDEGMPPAMAGPPKPEKSESKSEPKSESKPDKKDDDDDDDDDAKCPPEKTGAQLRKFAAALRKDETFYKALRRVKAAQMLSAATSLKHLTEA